MITHVARGIYLHSDKTGIVLSSPTGAVIGLTNAELPALLARLQEAAGAMQIPTKQGEMVAACKAALHALEIMSAGKARDVAMEQLQQAIAKAEQQ